MAGIGFALRKLTRRDDLLGVVHAYGMSAILASGPWLFTIIAIATISLIGRRLLAWEELMLFRAVVTYNFAFSLVLSGPITLVATRVVADGIFAKDVRTAPGVLLAALGLYTLTALPVAVGLYGVVAQLSPAERLGAWVGLFLVGYIWIATVFVSALKDFKSVATIFGAGMLGAVGGCAGLAYLYGAAGMIMGFNLGLGVIFFALTARILAEYPHPLLQPGLLLTTFRRYWMLGLSGFAYNCAIWIDKWLMWFLAPQREPVGGVLYTYPYYDSAMFLAYLITIPATALFFVSVETDFFERFQRFYLSFQRHATWRQIVELQQELIDYVAFSFRNMTVFVACLTLLAIVSAASWFETTQIPFQQIGIYRLGVVGAFFHILLTFVLIFLSYFDLRHLVLGLNLLFLAANTGFTLLTLAAGFPYYGAGYAAATALTFLTAFAILIYQLRWLPYQAFVANNPTLKGKG